MKTKNEDKSDVEENANNASLRWRLIALFLPIAAVALMLMSAVFIKDKVAIKCHVSNSFGAGDVALFVAMPLFNAAVK